MKSCGLKYEVGKVLVASWIKDEVVTKMFLAAAQSVLTMEICILGLCVLHNRTFRPALLGDSGCIGLEDIYPGLIVTRKRSKDKEPSIEDGQWNSRLHSDRVLVENYFGGFKCVFGIPARPHRGALNALEDIVITCICLLNMMLKTNPLRKQDAGESEFSSETTLSMMFDSPNDPPSSKRGPNK